MQISIGSKQYSFTGDATPANIAQQISEQESSVDAQKLTHKLSQALFGAPYRKHDVVDSHRFEDGVLNLDAPGFERLFGSVSSGGEAQVVLMAPPPRVVIQTRAPESKMVPPPPVPADILAVGTENMSESKSSGTITKAEIEAHPVFLRFIAPMLQELRFTTFELTTCARDEKLETGAYFNPKSNCVVLDQNLPPETVVDNLIFELCNAKNKSGFESISDAFQASRISVSDYGNAYAATEFKTQMAYTSIAQRMAAEDIDLPPGARKALAWIETLSAESCGASPSKSQLLRSFMEQPHNLHADARDVSSLPSCDMYAFQALEKMGGQQLFSLLEEAVGPGILSPQFSGWARHSFPMKSVSYKRAQAYVEVVSKAKELARGKPVATENLAGFELSAPLKAYATLRAGAQAMPSYPR